MTSCKKATENKEEIESKLMDFMNMSKKDKSKFNNLFKSYTKNNTLESTDVTPRKKKPNKTINLNEEELSKNSETTSKNKTRKQKIQKTDIIEISEKRKSPKSIIIDDNDSDIQVIDKLLSKYKPKKNENLSKSKLPKIPISTKSSKKKRKPMPTWKKTTKPTNKKNTSLLGNKRKTSDSDIIEVQEIVEINSSKKSSKKNVVDISKSESKLTKNSNIKNSRSLSKNSKNIYNSAIQKRSDSSKSTNLPRNGVKGRNTKNISKNEIINLDEESKRSKVKNNKSQSKAKKTNDKNKKKFNFEVSMSNDAFNKSLAEFKGKLMDQLFTEFDLSTQKKNFIPKTFVEKMHEIQKKEGNLSKCVYCNKNDKTNYWCEKCGKFMHPECFMTYHKNKVYCSKK